MRVALAVLSSAVVIASARIAVADSVPMAYSAPPTCPDATAFQAAVRSRTGDAALESAAASRAGITSFEARVAEDPRGFAGRVVTYESQGRTRAREVLAPSCAEVVDALAFFVALALGVEEAGPKPKPQPTSAAPATTPHAKVAPAELPPEPRAWSVLFGVHGGAATKVLTEDTSLGLDAFVGLSRAASGLFAPELRVGARWVQATPAHASLALLAAWLEGCPFAFGTRAFAVRPCATFQLGALAAEGVDVAGAARATVAWSAAGPSLRLVVTPSASLFFELRGALEVTLQRHRFTIAPSELVAETPRAGGFMGAGFGVKAAL